MAAKDTITPGWFSIDGAALYTGFSVNSIRSAVESGRFPTFSVPIKKSNAKSVRIRREHLDAWIEGRPIETSPESTPAA